MQNNLILLSCGLLLAVALGQSANAQTQDGDTPANEGMCNDLKGDGITKGLYGLCVAFCEAQDHASILEPISEAEYDELLRAAPSGKILESYNRKKSETDPDMPCIRIQEPCPCWTEAELAQIDGLMWDGTASNSYFANEPSGRRCATRDFGTFEDIFAAELNRPQDLIAFTIAQALDYYDDRPDFCRLSRINNAPDGKSEVTVLRDLSQADVDACFASLRNFHANSGFCSQVDNDLPGTGQ